MKICIINGPNLNLLGKREPGIYGDQSFESYFEHLKEKYPQLELTYFQSNIEGELIDQLHGYVTEGCRPMTRQVENAKMSAYLVEQALEGVTQVVGDLRSRLVFL